MNVNDFIPIFVLMINFFIILILSYSMAVLIKRIHQIAREGNEAEIKLAAFYLGNLVFTIYLFGVNAFSFANHYLVYFEDYTPIRTTATWLRFIDRYMMFFAVIFNDVNYRRFLFECFLSYITKRQTRKMEEEKGKYTAILSLEDIWAIEEAAQLAGLQSVIDVLDRVAGDRPPRPPHS